MSDIEINAKGIDQCLKEMEGALAAIGGKKANKIIANAINQSLSAGRKEAARVARKAYTAPIKKLFDNIDVFRATAGNMEGAIQLEGSPGISLFHFKANPAQPAPRPKAGVSSKVKRKGARYVHGIRGYDKPFIMKKANGGFGIFVRKHGTKPVRRTSGRGKYYWGASVQMLFGPSPIQALQRKEAQDQVAKKVEETFEPRLKAEIDRALAALRSR